ILAEENVDNGTDETVQWTLTDHLNTVRDIAKYDSGSDMTTVVNHLIYDAFGRVTSETNPAVDSLFLFTARPFDADTGLQNNLSRWYDAHVGRWLSEDPIGFAGGDANLYRYVNNRSLIHTDPLALWPFAPRIHQPCKIGTVVRTLILEFDDCCYDQQERLATLMCDAARLAYRVWEMVDIAAHVGAANRATNPEYRKIINEIRPCLDHWFGDIPGTLPGTVMPQVGPISHATLLSVRDRIKAIAFAFLEQFGILAPRAVGLECESFCTGSKIAYTWTSPGKPDFSDVFGTDIHICPDFFKKDKLSEVGILLHEMSHIYAGTIDVAYVAAPAAVGGVIAPIYDVPGGMLSTDQRVHNAPSYEGFFKCVAQRVGLTPLNGRAIP
ncbi:RHS repeat-associated core domain-containing protein, partial [Thermogutta sp.]|uniref:RHS repeat-associated core domain-containing protein n=1 Tax=Thermogutta sp. TaxID=1962930 RepID=UPI00322032D0